MTRIAVLGGGRIGEALLGGLVAAGYDTGDLVVAERSESRAAELADRLGIVSAPVEEAVRGAGTVVVAVKPQDAVALISQVAPVIGKDATVISLCAGLPTSLFEGALPEGTPVVRVMPNTPMLLGEAMCALSAGTHASDDDLARARELLSTVGSTLVLPETKQDVATALSGSGPAYFFLVVESMIEAGVAQGLARPDATELVVQTALGAARMLRETGEHPAVLRENVTSPGGTTAAALAQLERHGIRTAFADAVTAAHDRSVELGQG
ncbi:pyrroline-5-carboxylate reductase [Pseudonocardia phyllosphaerae]|uniref:pyrroline-5-carboxylate reductase n=1 Tax=Pseudonocardia phyllosphaerae TaxID=3390502 RepID=UPI00397BF74D